MQKTEFSSTLAALTLLFFGCGEPATQTQTQTQTQQSAGGTREIQERAAPDDARPTPRDPRALPGSAVFGDLVEVARALDERRDSRSESGCLLRASPGAYRLEADLAVAVRPLPQAPEELDARLATAGHQTCGATASMV